MTCRLHVPVFVRADTSAIRLSVCLSQSVGMQSVGMLCRVSLPHIRIQALTAGDDALSLVAQTNGVILVNENRM